MGTRPAQIRISVRRVVVAFSEAFPGAALFRHALARSEGNISQTAKLLGISRPTLYDLLKQYDMQA